MTAVALQRDETEPLFAPASRLAGRPVPPREWHVGELIPSSTVTMLGGAGATGKSLLALQLAVATATDRPWIGRPVERPGTAMFLSAEDDDDELHRRLADICRAEDLELASLDKLLVKSLAGRDALLAILERKFNMLAPTPLYHDLDGALGEHRPALLVLDTLADLHAGNENERSHARQFVGLLRHFAIKHECAVLLLAHPSLTGMSSGSGLSGSTAWDGSVRSRLYLERVTDEGHEPDPNARRLSAKKANYGPTGGEIGLTWKAGVFVADAPEIGLDRMAANARAERVFLTLLAETEKQGRRVNPAGGQTYAPNIFAGMPGAEGCTKRALRGAMETLLANDKIRIAESGPPSKRRQFLEVTP